MVTKKATVRRLPSYLLAEDTSGNVVRPDQWYEARPEIQPPSAGSEHSNPSNLAAKSLELESNPSTSSPIYQGEYWESTLSPSRSWVYPSGGSVDQSENTIIIAGVITGTFSDLQPRLYGKSNNTGVECVYAPDFGFLFYNVDAPDGGSYSFSPIPSRPQSEFIGKKFVFVGAHSASGNFIKVWTDIEGDGGIKSVSENADMPTTGWSQPSDNIALLSKPNGSSSTPANLYLFSSYIKRLSTTSVESTVIPGIKSELNWIF